MHTPSSQKQSDIIIFDRNLIRKHRNRCAPHLSNHGFLIDWSMEQIIDRINDIKRTFPTALQIGNRTLTDIPVKLGSENLFKLEIADNLLDQNSIQADEECLPFADNSFDLIFSPLNLHTTNDLPGTLLQVKNALKPDGLFIAAILGGETLYELRHAMNTAETNLKNSLSPRVAPFADMQQMGALMQRAGFSLPVVDSEKVVISYDHPIKLMQDLRLMGENNALLDRHKAFMPKQLLQEICKEYAQNFCEDDGCILATFEVIFLIGWKDHTSQQKPLRPGSADNRLADALQTKEEKL